jgi:acyl transferase domain-containing protein
MSITAAKARMLAPDGRCKTFDARADGFVRAEGCGVVVLKRLSDAVADGDRVVGLIRGSAVNQDGRSSGLTVPNKLAQESLIREALARAGVAPGEVGYVEAHGTGTSLGDPIEVRSLAAVLGKGRTPGDPFVLGSVKTNIGHLESAAGVAGLIKVLLSLQNEEIPPHLHFNEPNPHVDWAEVPAVIPTQLRPWPRDKGRRVAGVSSFGVGGTNAHAIMEEAPAVEASGPSRPWQLILLSAKSGIALETATTNLAEHLKQHADIDLGDVLLRQLDHADV